uniref:Protein ZIP4 homolog n=1 Tax=Sphaeramia orbicularis TaxID=375764 RepID=A0A673AES9_9TELE
MPCICCLYILHVVSYLYFMLQLEECAVHLWNWAVTKNVGNNINKNQKAKAVVYMQRCREMLLRLPKETAYVSLMCYNFGVDTYQLKKFEDSSFWLSQSYDIGKMNEKYSPGSEIQAKILRLLATVYLEWDWQRFQEKALNAVSLANEESISVSGLYLKIRILLRCGAPDDHIRAGLNEMLQSDVSLEVCLSTVKLLMSEDREVLGFEYMKCVCLHFESSPDLGSALVLHIELLLHRGKELLGKQKIEDIITGHYTGKQLTPQALSRLHVLLWDKASRHFETKNYSESLQWYNYSLSFFKAGQIDPNLAKLQRNRASCFLQLKQESYCSAKEAVKEAERCDPDSIFTQFTVYKIAVQENNVERAPKILQHYFWSACCMDKCVFVCVPATAWNSALQCESSPDRMRDFFVLSYQASLAQLCPPDRTILMGQKTCLLMAAAASLELCRRSPPLTQTEELTQALEHIQICWEVWKTLKASGSFPLDPTDTLLLLYEFEARAKLNDPKVETVLESVLELENVETKVLETIAALAMESPAHFPLLCKKALRVALSLHKKQPQTDLSRCSKCVHSLIKLSLPNGVSEVEAHVLEEVWDYYEEALSIITPDDFPEMETLWLLTRAWNTGILMYSLAQYPEAERWCGLAMSFIRHLGSLRESYETQVQRNEPFLSRWAGEGEGSNRGVFVALEYYSKARTLVLS